MKKIIIVDTGNANFLSIKRAVEKYEKNVLISNDKDEIKTASKIILPGVGSFKDGVNYLKKKNIFKFLKEISKEKPIMGICLGMQLLFEDSSEHGLCEGLKLIKGKIRPLPIQKIKKYSSVPICIDTEGLSHRHFDIEHSIRVLHRLGGGLSGGHTSVRPNWGVRFAGYAPAALSK